MHSDDYLTDVGIENSMPKIDKVLIIACGALAREIIDLIKLNNWQHMDLTCLPAKYHLYPEKITGAVELAVKKHSSNYKSIFIAYADCGQRCTAISRVIVHTDLEAQVIEGLAKRTNAITPSDGTKNGAQMGPLSSDTQLNDVNGFVERAISEGAKIAAGGTKINSDTGGYFYSPTILSGVTRNMEIARDEVFGPVMVVMTYSDIGEALSIANDVSFGLSSCLYSDQLHVVEKFIAESESGMLHINGGSFPQNHLPFVGVKDSALGVGGSNGASTIQFYTTEHTVYKSSLT
ncbi:aldehyde dehydrogenase family protein [Amylibacter sp.]|nr:aldehyde dehydrogenase family protein [Amylibacter sp.]